MNAFLLWFTRIWMVLFLVFNLLAIAGFLLAAKTPWEGWVRVTETYSPFNVWNWIVEIVFLLPAFGAYQWLQHRTKAEVQPRAAPAATTGTSPGEQGAAPEIVLREASKASVWIPWYFKRGALNLVTVPLFLLLLSFLVGSALGTVVQGLALLRASGAVFGFIGAFLALALGWFPVILPTILCYSLIKNLPGLWLRPDASRREKVLWSLAVLVLLPLAAQLVYLGVTWGIGWIIDRDPCAALAAGVTGSKVPANCR